MYTCTRYVRSTSSAVAYSVAVLLRFSPRSLPGIIGGGAARPSLTLSVEVVEARDSQSLVHRRREITAAVSPHRGQGPIWKVWEHLEQSLFDRPSATHSHIRTTTDQGRERARAG